MSDVRIIKRYRNRRLYDTHTRAPTTLAGIRALVQSGVDFRVEENHTHRDLTLLVLTQALGEQMKSWQNWGDTGSILRVLIQRGGDTSMTILSKTAMAAIGALAITRENAEKLIDELIKRGELDKSKRADAIREAVEKAETCARETVNRVKDSATATRARETVQKITDRVTAKIREAQEQVGKIRPASAEDVSKLRRTIEELETEIEELKAKLG